MMNWKRKTAALSLALFLTAGVGVASADFYGSYSYPGQMVNESTGETAEFLYLSERIIALRDMAASCGEEYVKPYFESQGIALTDLEAEAVAFAFLKITAETEESAEGPISYSAECVVDTTEGFDTVYANEAYIDNYVVNAKYLAKVNQEIMPARMSYAQYGDSESADVLKTSTYERTEIFETFANIWTYWHGTGASVWANRDRVFAHIGPFLEAPPNACVDTGDRLYPYYKDGKPCLYIDGNETRWLKVIYANGLVGYVQEEEIYWPDNVTMDPEDYIVTYVEE